MVYNYGGTILVFVLTLVTVSRLMHQKVQNQQLTGGSKMDSTFMKVMTVQNVHNTLQIMIGVIAISSDVNVNRNGAQMSGILFSLVLLWRFMQSTVFNSTLLVLG